MLEAAGLANYGGHPNFYSLFLMRALDCVKPGGGLVFVLPTSFVAGPYFSGLRQEILDRADAVRTDLHEQRENLFVGAVQDVCLLTLRRHSAAVGRTHHCYDVGVVDSDGLHKSIGSALVGLFRFDQRPNQAWTAKDQPVMAWPRVSTNLRFPRAPTRRRLVHPATLRGPPRASNPGTARRSRVPEG